MKKLKPQHTGGFVDNSLSDRSLSLIQSVPGASDELVDKIARRVGRYRDFRAFRDTEPQVAVLIRHLAEISAKSDQLREDLKNLPPAADAIATEVMHFAWLEMFPDFDRQLSKDLLRLSALMRQVACRLAPQMNRRGDHPSTLEHELLSDVAQMLEDADGRMGRIAEAGKTAEILCAAGVHGLPATPEKARKAILAWRKALDSDKGEPFAGLLAN